MTAGDRSPWGRVAIVGAPAVGKSRLAGVLEERLGLPHVELDRLRHGEGGRASDAEFAGALVAVTGPGRTWVMEGAETGAPVTEAWRRAQLLLWLDHRRPAIAWRILRGCTEVLIYGGGQKRLRYCRYQFRKLRKSFRSVASQRRTLPPELAVIRSAGVEVVRLRSRRSTRRWLDDCVSGGSRGAVI